MLITDYTSFDEVRAALGVSSEEVEDETLNLAMYAEMLLIDIEDVNMGIPALYTSLKATTPLTADQERFMQTAHLFATYAVARQLTTSLPLFSPEQITDGKAMMRRQQANNPYQQVIDAVSREFTRFRMRLDQMFAVVNSTAGQDKVTKTYFAKSSPSTDPITGS